MGKYFLEKVEFIVCAVKITFVENIPIMILNFNFSKAILQYSANCYNTDIS